MSCKGFTLLELLLSLTIMALVLAISFGVFHTGLRAWEKADDRIADNQRLRIVPELLKRQLASFTSPRVLRRDHKYFYFSGTEKRIEFFSRISLYPRENGFFYVQYRVLPETAEKEGLHFYEKDILSLHTVDVEELDETLFRSLLSGCSSISFAFQEQAAAGEDEPVWLPEWHRNDEGEIPRAIRITMAKTTGEPPIRLVIPLFVRDGG